MDLMGQWDLTELQQYWERLLESVPNIASTFSRLAHGIMVVIYLIALIVFGIGP